jgi:hypothetical protein
VFAGDHRTPGRSNSIALSARSSGLLRNGETVIADRVVEATILFCDLVGFTTLSQTLPADRVIDFLSKIFSAFARLFNLEFFTKLNSSCIAASGPTDISQAVFGRVEDGRGGCALRSPLRFLSPQADILAGLSNELSSSDPRGRLERKAAEPKHEPL